MTTSTERCVDAFYGILTGAQPSHADALMADEVVWCAAHPINDLKGAEAFFTHYWAPLKRALPDVEYRPFVRVSGRYDGLAMDGDGAAGDWVTATGYLVGTFSAPLFDIPPTHRTLCLRFGELIRVEDGKIAEGYVILDFVDAMLQAGVCPLRPSLGSPGLVLPPKAMDGLAHACDPAESAASLQLVRDMIDGLLRFDGASLFSMDQERFWSPHFLWYGPAGIGTSRGLDGFRAHHQGPFLTSFPKRGVDRTKCLVAEGPYVATGGWPHMTGSHLGGGWLGLPATGKTVTMRVMDWWRCDDGRLTENWVSIDILHILDQFGLDVFAQMKALMGGRADIMAAAGSQLAPAPPPPAITSAAASKEGPAMGMEETAHAFFDACETGRGWAACAPYCHGDARFSCQADALKDITSLEAYAQWMQDLLKAIPDGRYALKAFSTDEGRGVVSAAAVFQGTQTGPGPVDPPTGKAVASDYVYLMAFDGDRIRHVTKIWNDAQALRQLGWA